MRDYHRDNSHKFLLNQWLYTFFLFIWGMSGSRGLPCHCGAIHDPAILILVPIQNIPTKLEQFSRLQSTDYSVQFNSLLTHLRSMEFLKNNLLNVTNFLRISNIFNKTLTFYEQIYLAKKKPIEFSKIKGVESVSHFSQFKTKYSKNQYHSILPVFLNNIGNGFILNFLW